MIRALHTLLNLLWGASIAVAGIGMVLVVYIMVASPEGSTINWLVFPVEVEAFNEAGGTAEVELGDYAVMEVKEVSLSSSDPAFAWFGLVFGAVLLGFYFYGFSRLRAIVQSAVGGTPFIEANVHRIRQLGFTAIGVFIASGIGQFVAEALASQRYDVLADGVNLSIGLDATLLVGLLIIFALAEVFRVGVDLQDDHDMTV